MNIVDRRLNPGGKSLGNRQKFITRSKQVIKRAVREDARTRSIKDIDKSGTDVTIPSRDLHEPTFHHGKEGKDDFVLPGNRQFQPGDTIPRPPEGGGACRGGSATGDGNDVFRFVLSKDEYLNLFLEDLELPNMIKRKFMGNEADSRQRAGYTTEGSPSNMSLGRTMKNSLMRRIALRRPSPEEIEEAEKEDGDLTPEEADAILAKIRRIPYIDPMDVRYRRFDNVPEPKCKAVVFCLMDVSGSMSKQMKDHAKKFFTLLYLFLQKCYDDVEVVFIRHTQDAKEVNEQEFFYSTETGGTIVSTAFVEAMKVLKARYDANLWNVYVAQASDGDNYPADNAKTTAILKEMLPMLQYFAYIEISNGFTDGSDKTDLWKAYEAMKVDPGLFAMKKVHDAKDIYPVFRELFEKKD